MKKLLSCALGASLGLLTSAIAADPVPLGTPSATPGMPVPPAMAPGGSVMPGMPMPAASAADQIVIPPQGGPPIEHSTGVSAAAAPPAHGSLLDYWMTYYDIPRTHGFSAEALIWWVKGAVGPTILQDTPPSTNGFFPNGGIIIGMDELDEQQRYGSRLKYVHWFDRAATTGAEAIGFVTGDRRGSVQYTNADFPNLSRPFIATNPNVAGFLAKPVFVNNQALAGNAVTGTAITGLFGAQLDSQFWGTEVNYRRFMTGSCTTRVDGLVGFRYLNLDETLTLQEQTLNNTNNPFLNQTVGSRAGIFDRFFTDNDFYGAQVGTNVEYRKSKMTLDVRTTVAVGMTHEKNSAQGRTTNLLTNGQTIVRDGGFLALPSNIGTEERNVFSFVPQISGHVSYFLTPGLRLFAGYDFMYWSRVARVTEQIDQTLDATQIPNFPTQVPAATFERAPLAITPGPDPLRPLKLFQSNDFWAQGFSFGAELRW